MLIVVAYYRINSVALRAFARYLNTRTIRFPEHAASLSAMNITPIS
jgi:hypothetical protein